MRTTIFPPADRNAVAPSRPSRPGRFRAAARCLCWSILLVALRPAAGNDLVVHLPDGTDAAAVKSAAAVATGVKLEVDGKIDGHTITFPNVLPDTPYDLRLTQADGTVLQGVDLSWYTEDPARPKAEALTDDDREQVRAIVQDVPDFYNKKDVLTLRGDHDRAVGLLRLVRDKDFYNGKGEIVWRIELWYFENQAGGWAAVGRQNKVLRRERFKTADACRAATTPLRFVPGLGGLQVAKAEATKTVSLTKEQVAPVAAGGEPGAGDTKGTGK